jgi:hypothetical protein
MHGLHMGLEGPFSRVSPNEGKKIEMRAQMPSSGRQRRLYHV